MKVISLMAAYVGLVAIPQIGNESDSPDSAKDMLREACWSGALFEKESFEEGACLQYRSMIS